MNFVEDISSDERRAQLLQDIQLTDPYSTRSNEQIFTLFFKSGKFYAHKFILKLRVPNLILKANSNKEIYLKEYQNNIVWELLEFIYFNNSKTIKMFINKGKKYYFA